MKPWELVHRGRVEAAGIWIDHALVPRERAAERILALWSPGDTVFEAGPGWLVQFASPLTIDAEGPGLALVEHHGRLLAAPLRPEEWEGRPDGSLLQVRGGELRGRVPGARIDPSRWLELDLPVARVSACAPPPAPARPARAVEPVGRGSFGVDELSPEARDLLRDLLTEGPRTAPPPPPPEPAQPGWWQRLGSWFGGGEPPAARPPTAPPPTAPPPSGSAPGTAAGPSSPGLFDGLAAFFGQLFPGTEEQQQRRDEERLQAMLQRFDDDLEEALRHAIPLSGQGGGLHRSHPAWRRFEPRERLTPGLAGASAASSSIGAGPDLYERLRETYRRAAEALVAAGEIEKAAFVYADLLGELSEALELLEEHGLYRLAARLAESRQQDPARVARLYVLAGDLGRALQIANVQRVFGELVASFEGDDAVLLRAAYAAHLVGQDRYAAAVQALWDTRLRSTTRGWLELLVTRGGAGAAEALVKLETLDGAAGDEVFGQWLAGEPDAERLCELAVAMAGSGGPERWGRRLVRALWSLDGAPGIDTAVGGLLAWEGLSDLRADAPYLRTEPVASERRITVTRALAGGLPITDVVAVPNGTLCALGEGGLVQLDAHGREVWRDPTPCTSLVADEEGFRLLGVHPAGPLYRVLRVDLRLRRVELWRRTRLTRWSRTCVAGQWLVHDGERPLAIDTSVRDRSWRWIWQGPTLDAPVVLLQQDRTQAHIAVGPPIAELFSYDDTWFMRGRSQLAGTDAVAVHAGTCHTLAGRQLFVGAGRAELVGDVVALEALPDGPWAATVAGTNIEVRPPLRPGGHLVVFEGTERVGLRASGTEIAVFDDQGRLLWLDAVSGRSRGPWRVV